MYLMYTDERAHLSLPDIGRIFGNRDHTTVLYGVRKIDRKVDKDRVLAADIASIRRSLAART